MNRILFILTSLSVCLYSAEVSPAFSSQTIYDFVLPAGRSISEGGYALLDGVSYSTSSQGGMGIVLTIKEISTGGTMNFSIAKKDSLALYSAVMTFVESVGLAPLYNVGTAKFNYIARTIRIFVDQPAKRIVGIGVIEDVLTVIR